MDTITVAFGPFPPGAVLTAVAAVAGAAIPFWYRYVYGAKSRISFSRLSTIDDSKWRDGRRDGRPVWNRRILVRASNDGWRDGVVSVAKLNQAVVWDHNGERTEIICPEDGVHEIKLEHYSGSGEMVRLSPQQRTNYHGQIINGRDDELMAIVPFILQDSRLGKAMQRAKGGEFTFTLTVEDNDRVYSVSVDITTEFIESAGGELKQSKK